MKTVVSVLIFNRKKNLLRWLDVWKKINPKDAELRIIHNVHPEELADDFKMIVESEGITYIPRINKPGMDIGAFQDICKKRLPGFKHDFDFLIWFADDTFPMRASFIEEFLFRMKDKKTGITCYEISPQIKRHIRTTGFCLRAEMLSKITFDVDPIKTKDHCWEFEHRSQKNLLNQIIAKNLDAVQISPVPSSPVWDSGGGGIKWPDRENEFLDYWKMDRLPAKVIVIAPAFNEYPEIVSSMICQTYKNWELHLVHDGPAPVTFPKFKDDRIVFVEMPHRRKEFGHPIRMDYLDKIKAGQIPGEYVLITNADNYHAPHFLEKLVKPLEENPSLIGSYCSMMAHTYKGPDGSPPPDGKHFTDGYGVIETQPKLGFIDCAAVIVRAGIAGKTGWPSTRHSSDWDYLNTVAHKNGGWGKFAKVFGALLTHN